MNIGKCIIWPGKKIITIDGYTGPIARYYCWIFHGPPPNLPSEMIIPTIIKYDHHPMWHKYGGYHAAHSCGNGPLCINPEHLNWKTPFENSQDSKWHKIYGKRVKPIIQW